MTTPPPSRILTLDSSLARCAAAIVEDGQLLAVRQEDLQRGQAARLPVMVQDVLEQAGVNAADLDLVAVTVGPGSFTGIRAALALAHGLALAAGRPLVGVSVGEALAAALAHMTGRSSGPRSTAAVAGCSWSMTAPSLPTGWMHSRTPPGPVALAGDAARVGRRPPGRAATTTFC